MILLLFHLSSRRMLPSQPLQKLVNKEWLHVGGCTLSFGEVLQATGTEFEFSFSAGRKAGTHILHSAAHGNQTLFFLGTAGPREWVVWDVPDKTGDWERLELEWGSSEKTFKIKGHDRQYVKWEQRGGSGVLRATDSSSKATEFVLREAGGYLV